MRIAVSGAHRTGKTTLVEALGDRLRGYTVLEEPYLELEADGFEFSDPPTIEDFEAQLRHSLAQLADAPANAILDRCPLDFLAYLRAIDPDYDTDAWHDDVTTAMEGIDLLVLVPIEHHVVVAAHEDRRLRTEMDSALRDLLPEDALEVSGRPEQRLQQILAAMAT